MRLFRFIISLLCLAWFAPGGAGNRVFVENPLPIERKGEMVEISGESLSGSSVFQNRGSRQFVLLDGNSRQVPYQVTHDGNLIFQSDFLPGEKKSFTLAEGLPEKVDTVCCGRLYPERLDDMTWENDHTAYRAYGPALQKRGERAFGYDIWNKSVNRPIVEERYEGSKHKLSIHQDHGNGMDVFSVGPTLGAGTAALLDSHGEIAFPWCFEKSEVLDNGPLRFTVRLIYPRVEFDGDSIVESRLISLDKGSWLNKTVVRFDGLKKRTPLLQGIVLHAEAAGDFYSDSENKFVSVVDLSDNPDAGNGLIYIGVVSPNSRLFDFIPLPSARGNAIGHVAAVADYNPASDFTYYWGSGWSKGGVAGDEEWNAILTDFSHRLKSPLKVSISD